MIHIISAMGDLFGSIEFSQRLHQSGKSFVVSELSQIRHCMLPQGFRFLVRGDMTIVEPVLLYLRDKCLVSGRIQSVGNTQKAYAEDLYEWWMWLEEINKEWNLVDIGDLTRYRDTLLQAFSPHTHRRYKSKTIRRRLTTILGFYNWAFRRKLISENLDLREIREFSGVRTTVSEILPQITDEELVHPFSNPALLRVLIILGPRPPHSSEIWSDGRPLRDRLIATVQVTTGMRIDEVLSLTKYQILDLRAHSDDPLEVVKLRIAKTKGLRPRIVGLPKYVLDGLLWYIDHERKEAVSAALRIRKATRRAIETPALFVNGIQAIHRDVGNPLRTSTFMGVFQRAVKQAGLVHNELHRHPTTGNESLKPVADHTSHDLRHTFAVQTYHGLKRQGDSEPWKKIQSLLGHQQLSTTMDTYLRTIQVDEPRITDAMSAVYKQWHHDQA